MEKVEAATPQVIEQEAEPTASVTGAEAQPSATVASSQAEAASHSVLVERLYSYSLINSLYQTYDSVKQASPLLKVRHFLVNLSTNQPSVRP